ncbi:uncharacterized protein LOC115325180, partial [Ixodes scapularis]|uniref:uncharacterized protein LOC115325180 n=1 Tax=Ixodes scapularis TaxID=6945 RepID=UPI001C37FAD2
MAAAQGRVPAEFLPTPGEPSMPWQTWKRGFLNHLEATDAEDFPPKRKRAILLSFLGEEGNRVVEAFNLAGPAVNAAQDEFQGLLSALDTHFASAQNVVVERRKFAMRVQGPEETVLEYLGALRRLASFCDYGESLESRVAEMFISGIRNAEVQDRLIRESDGANAPSLERAVQLAQQFERTSRDCDLFRRLSLDAGPNTPHVVDRIQDGRGRDRNGQHGGQSPRHRGSSPRRERLRPPPSPSTREPSRSSRPRREPPPPSSGRERPFPPFPPRRERDRRQSRAPSRPFFRARPRDPPPGARPLVRDDGCFFCGRRSHPRDECPASGATCFSCGRVGHFANVCRSRPRRDRDQRQLALPSGRRASARGYYDRRQAGPTRTPVQGVGTFSEDDDDEMWPGVYTVRSPGGRREQRPGPQRRSFTADVEVNGFPLSILIDTGAEVSLLSDATFNRINRSGRIRLSKPPRTLVHYLKGSIPVLGCFHANVVFKDRFATILFYVVRNGRSLLGVDAVHDLKMILSGVPLKCFHIDAAAPSTAVPGHSTEAEVPQPSSTTDSSPSTHFSDTFRTSSSAVPTAQGPSTSPSNRSPSWVSDCSKLPPGFEEFEDLFSSELGLVVNQTHTVTVRRHVPPVQAKLRRLPFTLRESVTAEIQKLERQGVIERISASEWVSPIVVVKKRDGGIRICVDLRAPNRAVVIDSFPLPHIDELLNSLRGASCFSKLDLASAYHQVRLDPKSRDLTAFITHEGLFRFKRVCFGLASAPAAFQQVMSKILKDCPGVQFYLDDVIVYGSSPQEHDAHLREVLRRIKSAGMKLNRKAVFRVPTLSFLGHSLSAEGVAPLPSKIEAVLNFPTPSDPTQLKAFLGLVEYYSKFIPHCATVVEPMRRLLRKGNSFSWTPDVESAFQEVKTALQKAPILTMFDPTLPVIVSTDASNYGLGAVLQQQHGQKLKTVAFASRSLTDTERRYSVGEKEALAILWSCEKWHTYLWRRQFTIRTDHRALVTLMSTQGTGVRPLRISRWTARLFNYNFIMEYRKGADNTVADALSRLPIKDTENGTNFPEEVVSIVCASLNQRDFQDATARDPILPKVMEYISSTWPAEDKLPPGFKPYFAVRE